ncbi:MAG TPA: hydrogenase maturation protease [Candidatus Limnocylindrales bacterium]
MGEGAAGDEAVSVGVDPAVDTSVALDTSGALDAAGAGPAAGVLVVGYGNPLRSDDGVGPAVADRLAADPRLRGAEVRTQHQLTPELALDASTASLLVLIDAADDVPPGDVAIRDLAPRSRGGTADALAGRSGEGGPPLTHNVDPASVVTLAEELWGSAPRTVLVGIGPASLELGDRLTPVASAAVPVAVEAVVAAVAAWRAVAVGER